MSIENKFARFMRNTGPARFFIPLGVILIVFGIILLSFNTGEYAETTGIITEVVKCPYEEGEPQQYDVSFTYTVDGKEYAGTFSNLSKSFNVGESIDVYYDPENPAKITNTKAGGFLSVIFIAVGAVALVFGVFKTVKAFKNSKALDAGLPGGKFPTAAFDGFKDSADVTEYYFRFDGNHLKPGYVIEDANRKILFEGKMLKQALVGARTYEFSNHVSGAVNTHEIGHTVTQSYNDEFFSVNSRFKFDGKNIWDVLHERGLRISTNIRSKFPYCIYEVAKNGAPFARIETCGVYVHEDEEAQHKITVPAGNMYYRFWTASNDFDSLFLTIFAISETEQAIVE